jgi:hypothetical protein
MTVRASAALTAAVAVVLAAACHDHTETYRVVEPAVPTEARRQADERAAAAQRLAEELASLKKRREWLVYLLDQQKNVLARSEGKLRGRKADLARQKAQTDDYIDRHQVQVACAYASEVANRQDGEYSAQTRRCARVASIYCAVALINGSFRREVRAARQYIEEAEVRTKSVKAEIVNLEKEIETQRAEVQASRNDAENISQETEIALALMERNGRMPQEHHHTNP